MRRLKLMSIAQMVIFCIWLLFSMACFLYFILEAILVPGQGLGLFAATKMTLHTYAGLLVSILMIINGLVFFRPTQYIEKNTFNRIRKAWCENKENHTLSATGFALKMVSTIASRKTLIYLCGWTKDNEQINLFHKCLENEAFLNEFFGTKDKLNYSDILIIKSEIYKDDWASPVCSNIKKEPNSSNIPEVSGTTTEKYELYKQSIQRAFINYFDNANKDGKYRVYAATMYFKENGLHSGTEPEIARFLEDWYSNNKLEGKNRGLDASGYHHVRSAIEMGDTHYSTEKLEKARKELQETFPKIN